MVMSSRIRRSSSRRQYARGWSFELLERRQLMAGDSLEYCTLPAIDAAPAAAAMAGTVSAPGVAAATYALSAIPALSSLPGAAATLFLDFDGHFDAVWGSERNISTPAFDTDGNPSSFSDAEITAIRQIWQSVAEDFSAFRINVSTVQPASFADRVAQRVAIGGNGAWLGDNAGGVSYIESFIDPYLVNTSYVFAKNLGGGHWRYVADTVSHEAGHAFGLEHISGYDGGGQLFSEYYQGPGDGRAPIMGDSFDATRGVWWAGASTSAYTFQDDMNTIARPANGFGYRPDEHGNSIYAATALASGGSTVSASGVIMIMSDVDYFRFTTGAGQVTFSAIVPAGFNNLDTRLELRDAAGTLITSAVPSTSFNATVSATLAAGTYYVAVGSHGNYGDIGQYTLTGTIVPTTTASLVAPSDLLATRGPGYQVGLAWNDNATGETAYIVERRSDNAPSWAVIASLGANATSFVDANVAAGRVYEYHVKASAGGASSQYSNIAGTAFAPATPGTLTATAVSGRQVNLSWGNVSGELGYKIERSTAGGAWQQFAVTGADVTSYQDTGVQPSTAYQYRVRAYNYGGNSPYTNAVAVTTPTAIAQPPAAPSGLTGVAVSPWRVHLHWYDNSNNETAFVIQRSLDGFNWSTLGQVAANVTSVADVSPNRRTTYYYRVLALNEAGYSAPTNVVVVRTPSFGALL
jgi:hypothetical protein